MTRPRRELWETWNLQYFRALPTYRWLKRYLSYAAAFAAVGWVTWAAIRHDETPYSSGQISIGHLKFADDCMACHIAGRGYTYFLASDKQLTLNANCLTCHGLNIGHDPETNTAWHQATSADPSDARLHGDGDERTLACSSCHTEHEGYERLIDISDHQCVQCHADLKSHMFDLQFADHISTFYADPNNPDQNHPDFRILEQNTPDPGRIRFNHHRHLNPAKPILGPDGKHYRMRCDDCHRAGLSSKPWRFGKPAPHQPTRLSVAESELNLQRDYMDPINFNLHCSQCHALTIGNRSDQLTGDETAPPGGVPHTTPEAIQSYVRGQLMAYLNNPNRAPVPEAAETEERTPLPKFAGKPPDEVERLKLQWVQTEMERIEFHLYGRDDQACRHCHEIEPATDPRRGALPRIVHPDIPQRWFTSASFSHERHKALPGPGIETTGWANCLECHEDAIDSTQTADVLLPGIDNCRDCHAPLAKREGQTIGGVSYSCVFCHTYHRPPSTPPSATVAVAGGTNTP